MAKTKFVQNEHAHLDLILSTKILAGEIFGEESLNLGNLNSK